MSTLGNVRVGKKAPDFHCDAVYKGIIEEVTLSTFINKDRKTWLILLFIPAAFSFVCPTEVLAFQNCLEEFKDRNCEVLFISVDTKHSLWHWQNVPRQYGGLGQIDIALLSDASHKMSRDYGVLIEEEGVCLRGMFILDENTVVQQVTLNNVSVGRSVLEALRLLEAFQAVAKHGVLCPIGWKPSNNMNEIAVTISNTLTESYEERLANRQKEFGDTVVTDLDAKHKSGSNENSRQNSSVTTSSRKTSSTPSTSKTSADTQLSRKSSLERTLDSLKGTTKSSRHDEKPIKRSSSDMVPQARSSVASLQSRRSLESEKSSSTPPSASSTPMLTPSPQDPPKPLRQHSQNATARHARGHCTAHAPKPNPPPIDPSSTTTTALTPTHLLPISPQNIYESRRGCHVILEFADPTSSPRTSPHPTPGSVGFPLHPPIQQPPSPWLSPSSIATTPRPFSSVASPTHGQGGASPNAAAGSGSGSHTRLQATFEAIKKMSAGLTSPSPKRAVRLGGRGGGREGKAGKQVQTPGYFDAIVDAVEV
ncbi:thioredoxin-like protein [Karstenula rhodostoma CBS 690.94]|uniref:Thioredoxin-like protein n=1 Tax=Karstenula rhodostoma CBS 690.94 TaxID=1392251 RepID=A0A9P4PSQ0_9PLEO|nr:thioredoxin-like protein [Karstenula rhodostoma CBS 690.94]